MVVQACECRLPYYPDRCLLLVFSGQDPVWGQPWEQEQPWELVGPAIVAAVPFEAPVQQELPGFAHCYLRHHIAAAPVARLAPVPERKPR